MRLHAMKAVILLETGGSWSSYVSRRIGLPDNLENDNTFSAPDEANEVKRREDI